MSLILRNQDEFYIENLNNKYPSQRLDIRLGLLSFNKMMVTGTLAIASMAVIIFVVINASFGVSQNQKSSSGFKLYTNTDYNIKIEYPKNWKKSEQDLVEHVSVRFDAPESKDGSETA